MDSVRSTRPVSRNPGFSRTRRDATFHNPGRRPTTVRSPPRPPMWPRPGLPQLRNRSREPHAPARRPAQTHRVIRSRERPARNTQ
jgi:hypothetical protein